MTDIALWPTMAFSEAVAINPKRPLPKAGEVPFLDMASLPLHGAPVQVADKRPVASGGARFQAGDTLFARITPCAENGKLGFVCDVVGGTTAQGSTEFIVMGARDDLTLPEYVRWLSGWSFVRDHAIGLMEGTSGRQRIPAWAFDEIEVPVPPLDEQRRIAEVLRSVDEAIAAAQEAADQARALQSLLTTDRCFGHSFDMVSLGDILADIRYGTSVKCDTSEADGYPVLRIPNVVNGRVELDDLKYAAVSDADLRRFSLDTGDVVVVRTNGNPAYIGRSALIEDGAGKFLFASYLIRMRFDGRRAWAPYVFAALNSQPVRAKLLKAATTSAGNYNINTTSLKSIAIPLPNLEMQHQIGQVIRAATDAANACDNEVSRKRRVKGTLMSDLMSGHVRVPA